MPAYSWYDSLIKPAWAPPSWLFGPVWSVLYLLIFVSFGFIFVGVFKSRYPAALALPFALNLLFNFAFTPLQFGLRSNLLALIDIILVLLTLIWGLVWLYPHHKLLALANIPYLVWVSFATILQLSITWLNWSRS